jgi:hypothetical protein
MNVSAFYLQSTFALVNAIDKIKNLFEYFWQDGYSYRDKDGNLTKLGEALEDRSIKPDDVFKLDLPNGGIVMRFKEVVKVLDDMCGEDVVYFEDIIHEVHDNLKASWIGSSDNMELSDWVHNKAAMMGYYTYQNKPVSYNGGGPSVDIDTEILVNFITAVDGYGSKDEYSNNNNEEETEE